MQKEPFLIPKTRFYYTTTKSQKNSRIFCQIEEFCEVGLAEKICQHLATVVATRGGRRVLFLRFTLASSKRKQVQKLKEKRA